MEVFMFVFMFKLDLNGFSWEPIRRFAVTSLKWLAAGYIIALHIRLMGF